jgi:putative N6-adenine-specific DNA methylase
MISQQRTFFLTTIPGLESAAHLELCDKWGRATAFFNIPDYPQVEFYKGGVEFKAPLLLGLELNRYLRIPNRILLRDEKFDASEEEYLLAGLKKINWSEYFNEKSFFDFQLTSRSSKISMKIQVQKALEKVLKPHGIRYKKGGSTIFVRIFRDECNISLDCSGEIAFKRGQDKQVSIASLRDSTASGLLRILFQGIRDPFQLIDPMCGSGTFLSEALQINQKMKRSFNFETFPVYQKLIAENKIQLPPSQYNCPKKVFGFDNHEKAVHLAKSNGAFFSEEKYKVYNEDLFSPSKTNYFDGSLKKIVILNPPWGKRLPASSKDILNTLVDKFNPDRIGLLMPATWKINLSGLEKVRDLPITNSGVDNRFIVFSK